MPTEPKSLRGMLTRDEGRVPYVYQDSLGFWTIGVGHLVDRRKGGRLPEQIIDDLLEYDMAEKTGQVLGALPWVADLSPARQAVVICMAFQLGIEGLLMFKVSLGHLQRGDYALAAKNFLKSKAAREQTPDRWKRFAKQIETGEWII